MSSDFRHLMHARHRFDQAGFAEIAKAIPPDAEAWADLIETLAERFEPDIAEAFRNACKTLASEMDIEALADAISAGNLIDIDLLAGLGPEAYSGVWPPLHQVMAEAASLTAMRVANVRFDLLNPLTEIHFQTYGMGLIRQIGDETRKAIRQAVGQNVLSGIGPIETAREVRDVVGFGLTAQQRQAVANYRAELESLSSAAVERALRDRRYDPSVRTAIERQQPISPQKIDRLVERYQARFRDFRAQMIARTESLRGANAGSYEAVLQASERGAIPADKMLRFWMVAKDERTCPVCLEIAKINAAGVRLEEPFRTPTGMIMLPPQHPACRCTTYHRLLVD